MSTTTVQTSNPLDVHHTQVLERLQHLRLWQRQQQERIQLGSTLPQGNNPLQLEGHTISGSSLHSNDSGMLTGQSSAIDVLKEKSDNEEVWSKNDEAGAGCGEGVGSSGVLTPESHAISDTEDGELPLNVLPHDEIPVNPGIGPTGSAQTFEELLERKLTQYQTNSIPPPPPSSKSEVYSQDNMQTCASEDSFVVRGIERQQIEEAELKEFELLERAAAHDISFSSQCSLVSRVINSNSMMAASSPKTQTSYHPETHSEADSGTHQSHPSHTHSASPHSQSNDTLSRTSWLNSKTPQSQSHSRLTPVLPYIDEEEPIMDELDSTLRHNGMEFNDSQSWDSITEDNTPMKDMSDHASPDHSPQRHNQGNGVTQYIPPVRKVRVLPEPQPTDEANKRVQYNPDLPPPSALVAKLFPTLRKEREANKSKYIKSLQLQPKRQPQQHGIIRERSPLINKEETELLDTDSSRLDKQVKEKLKELEEEISRFKKENMTLDKLRKEREEVLLELKQELVEFNKQKEEQMRVFEEYKTEEIRKLKKERKVFEAYQREVNAAKDQKMKEELTSLRQEIEDLQDEMRSKELRWTSTVSRYRVRIESLESQNNELQNDLRMMEEQRLIWWQQQLEAKRSPLVVSKKTPPRSTTSCSPSQLEGKQVNNTRQQKGKHRRPSDPIQQTKKNVAQYNNKENKNPLLAKGKSTVKKAKKHNVTSGVKSTLKQSNTNKVKVTQPAPLEPIDTTDDKEGVATGCYGDDCDIIEVRGVEHNSEDNESEEIQAEQIVNAILNTDTNGETTESYSSDVNVKRSVRFQDFPLSQSDDDPNPTIMIPPLKEEQEDNQTVQVEEDGSKIILFPNGTKKMVSPDGQTSTVYYYNGDIKRILPDLTIVYVYSKCQTVHKTLPDGKEVIEFTNGQVETRVPNGDKVIDFPDGTVRHVYSNGEEKVIFGNGTIQYTHNNGEKSIEFTDGQKEVHTKEYKRRIYPDGTIKTVYLEDGRQETQYSNGTVRIKDKHGHILSVD